MKLRTKGKFSSWQLVVLLMATGIGSQIILAPHNLISTVGNNSWICVLAGGALFFFAGYMMLRLAALYPDKNLTEYFPVIWGKPLGFLFIIWFVLVFFMQVAVVTRGFSRVIAHSMFSRTPEEAIAFLFIALVVYGAMQSWGVLVRVQQFLLFVALPLASIIWFSSVLNFQYENVLPILADTKGLVKGTYLTWDFYSGYELILLIYPLIYRQGLSYIKAFGLSFALMTAFFTAIIIITIGVLTANTASNIFYPTLAVIKGVEIPGTFVERLELYLILLWIPTVFDTHMVFLAVAAFTLADYFRIGTHRLWIMILLPPLWLVFIFIDSIDTYNKISSFVTALGVGFSFGVIPLTLAVDWLKRRSAGKCELSS